ncbi:hypothetical protein [Haloarchaeobius baliensis]|uniref:hypothetical protein n=1 Tax=Haloarchaeobius baliensis TaxID=1670458 RepID=UPI003F880E06
MRRRALLTTVAAGSLAGCLGAAEVAEPQPCSPGDHSLGSLPDAATTDDPPDTVRVRAAVAGADYRLTLTDGTGWGLLSPNSEHGFDGVERGDCVAATSYLDDGMTRLYGVPTLTLPADETVEIVDEDPAGDPPTVPSPPDATFEVRSDGSEAVVLQNAGPESITAERLQVRNVTTDGELLDTARWSGLTEKAPDDPVTVGDSLRFEWPGDGVLCWRGAAGWSEPLTDSWSIE